MSRSARMARAVAVVALLVGMLVFPGAPLAGQSVPTPASHFGFEPGSHRRLADWEQLVSYYARLARVSDRVRLDTLGRSTRGRPFVMLTVTSPANHARLDELRQIQAKLADPRLISGPAERASLLDRGRTVVLITHGIHATEVGSAQMAPRLLHRLASSDDPEILRILDEVVLLDIPSLNPDGLQWVVEWYRRFVGTPYEGAPLPWLYHAYVGHDNNRDWYAFTQVETQLTVQKAHNVWRPQIVHDVHQMGGSGARIFFPPYVDPWEPNVDPALTASVNQLGSWMAGRLLAEGRAGVVINAIYDAWTPARAYQHYHAGARILSETASARLASPVRIEPGDIGGGRGYDAAAASWHHPLPWQGESWGLPDIVDYMDAGAMALLENAAAHRRYWLESFLGIGERAVEGWERWPGAWILPGDQPNRAGLDYLVRILRMGDVEVYRSEGPVRAEGETFAAGSYVIPMRQPYAAFAQTLLERQEYPDLREYPGGPPVRPYDVTAHTLPLLMDVEAISVGRVPPRPWGSLVEAGAALRFEAPAYLTGPRAPRIALYKSWDEPMEEGWTRWLLDRHAIPYDTLHDADIRRGGLAARYDVLLLQSQSARSIRDGLPAGSLPPEYTGGLGDAGTRAIRDFVRNGGRLVAVEEAAELAAQLFGLGVANAVERLPATSFYIPGSLLALEVDAGERAPGPPLAAWYGQGSRAFDVTAPAVRVLARYGTNPLLSGWALGAERVAGRPALVEAAVGRGSVVLFGFQPNYRGQSLATWPLLFRSLAPGPGAPEG